MYDRATTSHHRRHSQGYRVTDYESSDEENQPPPNLQSRTAWNNAVQEYQRQRQELNKRSNGRFGKNHIPIDDDSDSGSDSPKHWQKNPLCVRKTKKRSNGRPSSGEIYMRDTPHSVDSSPSQFRRNARRLSAPNIQESNRFSPLAPGRTAHIQQQVQKFEELQQRRRALDSSSDDNEGRARRPPAKASDLVLVPESPSSATNGHLGTPRVIAWRLSPKGHEMLQTQPITQRHSAYDNMPSSAHPPRTLHYSTASQQEVTSPVSHFVSSRNEANVSMSGRHSADQFVPTSGYQANMNGRHSADQLDGYQSQYSQQPQRMFSSQQNLSTTYQNQPGNQRQPMNGYYGYNNNNKRISPPRKPQSHISRRDQDNHPQLRQQFRPKSSDDVRWENYLGIDKNGTLTLDDARPGDRYHDAYPMDRYQTEEFRNVSSSWENLYDSADLSMVRSETHQVDYRKQPRNRGHDYPSGYPRGSSGPAGDQGGYRQIPYSQSDRHYGQDNPGYASPDSDEQGRPSHGSKSRRSTKEKEGYDAKALMQEEQQKYAEYKAEYVRRQSSSHSSENEDSRSDQSPYKPKRLVHHERQPALYGDPSRGEPPPSYQDKLPSSHKQRPDQYLYSPQQKRRVPQEQLPATRAQHIPDMSRYPPNSYVQYKDSQPKTRHDGYGFVTYHQQSQPQSQPPATTRSEPREPDNRHKYIREYEIPGDPIPKPKQEFILRWGPQQKSPSVERVIGRHTPDREGSRFGPQDVRSHKRSASDGYAHPYEGGGMPPASSSSDRHRSPSVERTERYSSPDRQGRNRTYQMPGSPRRSSPKKQHWYYNQTYEEREGASPPYDARNADVISPTSYDTLKSTSSSGHSAPARTMQQGVMGAELSRHSQSVPAINQYHSGSPHYVELNQIRQNKRLTDDTMFGQVFRVTDDRRYEPEKKSEPSQSQAADRFEQRIRQHRQQHKEEMEELLNVENELQKVKSSLAPVHRQSPQVTYQTPQEQHQSPPSQNRVSQISYSRSPHAQQHSSPTRSPTRRKYVIAEARASDPPKDDRPQDINIRHIKDTLLAQSGDKYDEGRSSAEPELTWIFEKKVRSVDELKSEVFNREDESVPAVQPHMVMPGRRHHEDRVDERITDYVSYYDGQTQRRPNINDPLADLERTYDQLQEQQREQHTDHRPGAFIDPGVKRLSITNVRRLEQYQPTTEHPSLDYTRSWLQAPDSSEAKSQDDDVFIASTTQPQYRSQHRDGDTHSSVSRTSDGQRSYLPGSALPRKVADDMAYRRQQGAPANNKRQSGSQGYVTYTTTSLTPATSQDSLSRRSVPDPVYDDAVFRKQRSSSQPRSTSDLSATSPPLVPNKVSTDYLEPRTTPPARGRMRLRPDKEADRYHDDYAYRNLRKDVEPVKIELPASYLRSRRDIILKSHERSRSAERPRNIQEISTRERRSSFSSAETDNKVKKQLPLSRGIAKMVELFNSPRELSHSAPDLVHQSVFSHKYDDQGEPNLHGRQQLQPQPTPMTKARRQQTPRVVKQRHELRSKMKMLRTSTGDIEYEEYSPEKSDSYSSSGGEGHPEGRSQRSPPDGAFDADDLEVQKAKNVADMKPIPISRIVSKPPTASETAPRLPPSTRPSQLDTAPKVNTGGAIIREREISSTGMRQWTASRPGQQQSPQRVTAQHPPTQGPGIPSESPMYNMLFPAPKPQQPVTQQAQWGDRPGSVESRSSVSSSDVVHKSQAPKIQFPQKALVIERKSSSSSSSPGDSPDAAPQGTAAPFPRSTVTTTERTAPKEASVAGLQASLTKPVKFTPSDIRPSERYASEGTRSSEKLLGSKPQFPTSTEPAKPQQGQLFRTVNVERSSDRVQKVIQPERPSPSKQVQRPSGPPPSVPTQAPPSEPVPVAPQRTKHLQKKATAEKVPDADHPSQGPIPGQGQGPLSILTFGNLLKDSGLSVAVMGPGGDRQVETTHTVESGDNFHKEQYSKTEFQQNQSSNVQVTSSGQVIEQRQMVKQQRTVMVMSKTSKTSTTASSGGQPKSSATQEKKKRKDKFDIDALVAKNAALAMSEDELENVSDYDNFTDTNLEISSDDGGSTTETGTMSDGETLHDRSFGSQELEKVAEMSPDVAHERHEKEIAQKPPGVPADQRPSAGAEGMRKVDWGKATPKAKEEDGAISKERRRSIKELVDNFESKMSPFS